MIGIPNWLDGRTLFAVGDLEIVNAAPDRLEIQVKAAARALQAAKGANTGRTAAGATDDPDLVFPAVPAGTYSIDGYLGVAAGAGGFVAALRSSVALNAGQLLSAGAPDGVDAVARNVAVNTGGGTTDFSLTSLSARYMLRGVVGFAAPSDIAVAWGLVSASGTTSLLGGSWLRLTLLP